MSDTIIRVMSLEAHDTVHQRRQREGYKAVGAEMRALRESKAVSLRRLADHLAVSAQFLSDMERGNRHYTLKHVKRAYALLMQ